MLVESSALESLELRSVFIDDREEPAHGFAAMRELLLRGDVRVVLLPDLGHVAHIPTVAHLTRAGLGRWLNAVVLLASTRTSTHDGSAHRVRAR